MLDIERGMHVQKQAYQLSPHYLFFGFEVVKVQPKVAEFTAAKNSAGIFQAGFASRRGA